MANLQKNSQQTNKVWHDGNDICEGAAGLSFNASAIAPMGQAQHVTENQSPAGNNLISSENLCEDASETEGETEISRMLSTAASLALEDLDPDMLKYIDSDLQWSESFDEMGMFDDVLFDNILKRIDSNDDDLSIGDYSLELEESDYENVSDANRFNTLSPNFLAHEVNFEDIIEAPSLGEMLDIFK